MQNNVFVMTFWGRALKKKLRATPKNDKIKNKVSGPECLFFWKRPFSWGRSVGFLKVRGFAGKLPRRGFFPRRSRSFFIYAKLCVFVIVFGRAFTKRLRG